MKTLNLPLVLLMPDSLASAKLTNTNQTETNSAIYAISNNEVQTVEILNFDDIIRSALYCDFLVENPNSNIKVVNSINKSNLEYTNQNASLAGEPSFKDIPYGIYFGESIFENGFDTSQSFSVPSFNQTVTNTFTTDVKWGISNETKVKFSFFDTTFTFNYNKSDSETKTTSVTLESPSQTINVPASKKYKVTIYLSSSEGDVYVNLNEDISGKINGNINDQNGSHYFETTIGKAFAAMEHFGLLPHSIIVENDNKIHFNGLGTISAYGSTATTYNVKMEDITNT